MPRWTDLTTGPSASHGHYGYTGQEYDAETGLLYLRARYYDPAIGRFISADPYWGRLNEPASQNRYSYVHNNPLMYTDPLGLDVYVGQRSAFIPYNPGQHMVLIFVPNDPGYFVGYSQFDNGIATLGGQPTGSLLNPGHLQGIYNYPRDDVMRLNNITRIPTPPGVSDADHIRAYMIAFDNFQNETGNLVYSPVPMSDSTFNSNGLITGAQNAVGDSRVDLLGWQPGSNNPVPIPSVNVRNDASYVCY